MSGGAGQDAAGEADDAALRWSLATLAAALLALDPVGLGGAVLRGGAGPARDAWLGALRATAPDRAIHKVPSGADAASLHGGLDVAATLGAGRPVAGRGLLAAARGGVLLVPMAERLDAAVAGPLAAALDARDVAAVLLDEGVGEQGAPSALAERVAFRLDLDGLRPDGPSPGALPDPVTVARARERLPDVAGDAAIEPLCLAGVAFGVPSLRVAAFALRAAKAAAALDGRRAVAAGDVERAAALVIAPRATRLPSREEESSEGARKDEPSPDASAAPPPPSGERPGSDAADPSPGPSAAMADRVVEATRAAIPAGLLAVLGLAAAAPARPGAGGGRTGLARQPAKRGRPAGVRRGAPGPGARLALVATLRAAAPWQVVRRRMAEPPPGAPDRVLVRREDLRVARFERRREAATLFVVDASGSAALHRLAEAKGAVELILADCYVRRDSVALIAFRGGGAEVLLAPTRSLARAKRALAGQPGGGGTPLAAAVDAAARLAEAVRRGGQVPLAVFLTDGRANVDRAGRPGRRGAEADALAAARAFRAGGCAGLVLDVAPRPGEAARALAGAMGARYLALPYADARSLSRAVLDG